MDTDASQSFPCAMKMQDRAGADKGIRMWNKKDIDAHEWIDEIPIVHMYFPTKTTANGTGLEESVVK